MTLMDEGSGNFLIDDSFLTADQPGLSFANPRALLPVSSPSALHSAPAMAPADEPPFGLTDGVLPRSQRVLRTSRSLEVSHASPLSPLRSSDREALDDIFSEDELSEMVLDVHRQLSRLYPEPCWEDEPYDFLHGYI